MTTQPVVRLKMLVGAVVGPGKIWNEGEVHDAPLELARELIHHNQAVALEELPPAPPLTVRSGA